MSPKEATIKAMEEVSAPVIGIALILSAVFVPVAMLGGLVGSMYKQFALTIAISVLLSAFNALSLTPALCAMLLKAPTPDARAAGGLLPRLQQGVRRHDDRLRERVAPARAPVDADDRDRRRGGGRGRPLRARAPGRVHPGRGPGDLRRQRPASARGLARAHQRGAEEGRGHPGEDRRDRLLPDHRRLRGGDQHVPAELRHDLRAAEAVGGAEGRGAAREGHHGEGCSGSSRRSRRRSSSRSTSRRCPGSAPRRGSISCSRIAAAR